MQGQTLYTCSLETCPICGGSGKKPELSFRGTRRDIIVDCKDCRGSGEIEIYEAIKAKELPTEQEIKDWVDKFCYGSENSKKRGADYYFGANWLLVKVEPIVASLQQEIEVLKKQLKANNTSKII